MVKQRGGVPILRCYGSLEKALKAIYPEYSPSSRPPAPTIVPFGYWNDEANLMKALTNAEERLGIKQVLFTHARECTLTP